MSKLFFKKQFNQKNTNNKFIELFKKADILKIIVEFFGEIDPKKKNHLEIDDPIDSPIRIVTTLCGTCSTIRKQIFAYFSCNGFTFIYYSFQNMKELNMDIENRTKNIHANKYEGSLNIPAFGKPFKKEEKNEIDNKEKKKIFHPNRIYYYDFGKERMASYVYITYNMHKLDTNKIKEKYFSLTEDNQEIFLKDISLGLKAFSKKQKNEIKEKKIEFVVVPIYYNKQKRYICRFFKVPNIHEFIVKQGIPYIITSISSCKRYYICHELFPIEEKVKDEKGNIMKDETEEELTKVVGYKIDIYKCRIFHILDVSKSLKNNLNFDLSI